MDVGPLGGRGAGAGGDAQAGHHWQIARQERGLQCVRGVPLLLVQPGVVQRDGRDGRELLGEREIGLVEAPLRLGLHEGERAEPPPADGQRHDQRRTHPDGPDEGEVLPVDGGGREQLVGNFGL